MLTMSRSASFVRLFSALSIIFTMVAGTFAATPLAYAAGTISLVSTYSENFDSLASTGTSSTTPNGWYFAETGANANSLYNTGTGSNNAGDTYSFGAASTSERALGGLLSGSLTPTIGASLTNNSGGTITDLNISYTGEQWRLGTINRADRLDFQYSTDATSLATGTWNDVNALDFSSPFTTTTTVGALNGNSAANRTAISSSINGLTLADGATIWVRWNDFNASGSDDGLAIDDLTVNATVTTPLDAVPTVTSTVPANGATAVAVGSNITVTFSESVDVAAGAISVECPNGNTVTSNAAANDTSSVVIDPASDLPFSTTCTIEVTASAVTDNDGPADAMAADFSASFTTEAAAPVDTAPSVTSTSPANGATNVAVNSNITVNFSEPVSATVSVFSLNCGSAVAFSLSGGPTSFVLDPNADLPASASCTLAVDGDQVSDYDDIDPPDVAADFSASFTTAGPVVACPASPTITKIHAIQGSGSAAAISGPVTVEGVVTGIFPGLSGIYMQEETADQDGNAATSEGLFVFMGSSFGSLTSALAVGEVVRIGGTAGDRATNGVLNTQLSGSLTVTDCGITSTAIPVSVSFPLTSASDLEPYEGMLATFTQELFIAEYFNYDRFGEIVIGLPLSGQDRFYTPTSITTPGASANALSAQYALRQITLDDGVSAAAPTSIPHPNGAAFSGSNRFRGADTVTNVTGNIEQTFGVYRVQPTVGATYTEKNPRPATPSVPGRIKVAPYNVLNYFPTVDTTSSDNSGPCGPSNNQDCRGADSSSEFNRQRTKLLQALQGLNADVFGLIELENSTGVDPLNDAAKGIVTGLNAALGAGTYAAINTGPIGTDAIRVGIIYKPAVVTPVGSYAILNTSVDPRFIDTRNRPALAQTFEENATGARFTVVVNHLKSKGSACTTAIAPVGADPDAGDGQGNCNLTRKAAAEALVDWLATDPTASADPDFVVIGDLNSYALEDPIRAIEAGSDDNVAATADNYTNLVKLFGGELAYSYVFDGQAGYLDHALSSASLTSQVAGAVEWHINADEPDIFDYNDAVADTGESSVERRGLDVTDTTSPFRTSDHDPILIGLNLTVPNSAPVAVDDSAFTAYKAPVTIAVLGNDSDTDNDSLSVSIGTAPLNGTATVNPDGTITYLPTANQSLGTVISDSFTYTISDGKGGEDSATVTLEIARLLLTSLCSDFPELSRNWRVFNPGTQPLSFTYEVYGTPQTGTLVANPGDTFFSTAAVAGPNTTIIKVNGVEQDVKASSGATCATTSACYASGKQVVESFVQGKRKNGSAVLAIRSNPAKALGLPQKNDTENFVSLGFGGTIVIRFDNVIVNGSGSGADFQLWETSYGDQNRSWSDYPEAVKVEASQNGTTWVELGMTNNKDQSYDLKTLAWAKYIRLTDVSNKASSKFKPTDDGFDVDAIEVKSGCTAPPAP